MISHQDAEQLRISAWRFEMTIDNDESIKAMAELIDKFKTEPMIPVFACPRCEAIIGIPPIRPSKCSVCGQKFTWKLHDNGGK